MILLPRDTFDREEARQRCGIRCEFCGDMIYGRGCGVGPGKHDKNTCQAELNYEDHLELVEGVEFEEAPEPEVLQAVTA